MKHKHYDMICAKAANMDLVIFVNEEEGESWVKVPAECVPTHNTYKFFACLPQHAVACLHWLNGGELMVIKGGTELVGIGSNKQKSPCWSPNEFMMTYDYEYKIKPRTEKRWIAYENDLVGTSAFKSKAEARSFYDDDSVQFIEIEVEVE